MAKKAAAAKKPRERKLRQDFLPGTEPVKNPRVHAAAEAYEEERDARIELSRKEKDAHATLLSIMEEEGLDVYEYGDLRVIINADKKCNVKRKKEKANTANGEE